MYYIWITFFILVSLDMGDSGFSFRSGAPRSSFPHDIKTKSGLNNLYNQRVTRVEHVTRPMGSSSGMNIPIVGHHGVIVTTANGARHLIHKGDGYGKSGQTVVVDAKHMSNKWSTVETRGVQGHTVGDFVKASGPGYNVLMGDHCITSAKKLTKFGGK